MKYVKYNLPSDLQLRLMREEDQLSVVELKFLREFRLHTIDNNFKHQCTYLPIYKKIEDIPEVIPLNNKTITYVGGRKQQLREIRKSLFTFTEIEEEIVENGLRLVT